MNMPPNVQIGEGRKLQTNQTIAKMIVDNAAATLLENEGKTMNLTTKTLIYEFVLNGLQKGFEE